MEKFGAKFKDERWEQNFNEDLLAFCRTIKSVAVEQDCPREYAFMYLFSLVSVAALIGAWVRILFNSNTWCV